jgi:hypothetical protein
MSEFLFNPERRFELGVNYIYPGNRPVYLTPELMGIYLNNYLDLVSFGLSSLDQVEIEGKGILDEDKPLNDYLGYRVARLFGEAFIYGAGFFNFHEMFHRDRHVSLFGTEGMEPHLQSGKHFSFLPFLELYPDLPVCVLEDQKGRCLEKSYEGYPVMDQDDRLRNTIAPFNQETNFLAGLTDQALDQRAMSVDNAISMLSLGLFHYVYLGVDAVSDAINGDSMVYRHSELNDISKFDQILWNFAEVFGKGSNYWALFSIVNYINTGESTYIIPTKKIMGIRWPMPNLNLWRAPEGYVVDWDIAGLDVFDFGDVVNFNIMHGVSLHNDPFSLYAEYRTGYRNISRGVDLKAVIGSGFSYLRNPSKGMGWKVRASVDTRFGGVFGVKFGAEMSQGDLLNHILDLGRTTGASQQATLDTTGLTEDLKKEFVEGWKEKVTYHPRYGFDPYDSADVSFNFSGSLYFVFP